MTPKDPVGPAETGGEGPRRAGHRKGPGRPKAEGPERRCIVSGVVAAKADLLRFVADPSGTVVPDMDGDLPGRGLWLSARRDMVETATRKQAFSRAARRKLVAPPDLADRVEALLRGRCLDRLGLAKRAGLVVAGFDKVRAAAKGGRVALLLEAADGAEDGRRKITALAPKARVVDMFSGGDLAAALGRDHVVHVAILTGSPEQRPLAARLAEDIDRYAAYGGTAAQVAVTDGGAAPETGPVPGSDGADTRGR
jgi:predicted RNA-binding protein YlxR (DUF448 family)